MKLISLIWKHFLTPLFVNTFSHTPLCKHIFSLSITRCTKNSKISQQKNSKFRERKEGFFIFSSWAGVFMPPHVARRKGGFNIHTWRGAKGVLTTFFIHWFVVRKITNHYWFFLPSSEKCALSWNLNCVKSKKYSLWQNANIFLPINSSCWAPFHAFFTPFSRLLTPFNAF